MKLSPLELRKHQFAKRFRLSGFDPDEVNGFVRQMADQWAEVLEENRRLEDRNRELLGKLTHYERVELALQEALETSRNTARQLEDNAQKKAELTVEEAELRAQRMLQDAEQERFGIKQDLVRLSSRQSEIAARMRAFLMAEMEVLAQFQGDDPSGFIRLVPANNPGLAGMLAQQATQDAALDIEAPEAVAPAHAIEGMGDDEADVVSDTTSEVEPEMAPVEGTPVEEPAAPPLAATPPAPKVAPPPVEVPITARESPRPVEQPAAASEPPPPIQSPTIAVEPPAAPYFEPDAPVRSPEPETFPPPPLEPYSRPPLPADPPISSDPPVFGGRQPVAEPPPPPPALPVWPPVEEARIMAPPPLPKGLESVEQLMEETPPPPPIVTGESSPRPTYRDMLSGTKPQPMDETPKDPFNSSFFESPFTNDPSSTDERARPPIPGSDAAHDWSLRELVTGDGDHEPSTPSTSESERDRIRRILEDLD